MSQVPKTSVCSFYLIIKSIISSFGCTLPFHGHIAEMSLSEFVFCAHITKMTVVHNVRPLLHVIFIMCPQTQTKK